MRALVLQGFDSEPVVAEAPAPEPAVGEVLVRLAAASVNAFDVFVANGAARDYMPHELPAVLGSDLAGTVEALGPDVEGFEPGQRVFGMLGFKGSVHDGTFAELATPQASSIRPTPDGVDDASAGSLGVAGATAANAVEFVSPGEGSTLLIVGATGGVGSFAVQLAALRGAVVVDLAGEVRERWPDGVDALIDMVNRDGEVFAGMAGLVRPGGVAVSIVGAAGEASSIGDVRVGNVGADLEQLRGLAGHVAAGRVRVPVQRTYVLEEADRALRDFAGEHTLGKLVITMG